MLALRRFATVAALAVASTFGIAPLGSQTATKPTAQAPAKASQPAPKATTPSASKTAAPSSTAPAAPKGQLLDINTATADQLKALPGIGDAYSKKIIDGRSYTAKNQLTSRGIIPQATYDKISGMIIAHRAAPGKP